MRLYFLLIAIIVLLPSLSSAQPGKRANLYLTNGSKIKSGIIKSFDRDYLEVEMTDSENILIRYDHIKKISFRKYGSIHDDFGNKLAKMPTLQVETFYHEFRGGLLFGQNSHDGGSSASGTIHTINGYQFNQYLGAGLGLGLNKYGNYLSVPIYATVKGYVLDKKVSPFYFGDIGYGIAWHNNKNEDVFQLENVKGGLYWQLGLGYQINFYNSSMTFSFGYINQGSQADYIYHDPWRINDVDITEKRLLRRSNLSIGLLF